MLLAFRTTWPIRRKHQPETITVRLAALWAGHIRVSFRRFSLPEGFGECPDQSVVICIRLLSAISLLLASGPDEHSPLTGVELVAQKVRYIVTMASMPFPGQGNERFNWKMDALAAEHGEQQPSALHISSTGVDVRTGSSLSDLLPQIIRSEEP